MNLRLDHYKIWFTPNFVLQQHTFLVAMPLSGGLLAGLCQMSFVFFFFSPLVGASSDRGNDRGCVTGTFFGFHYSRL